MKLRSTRSLARVAILIVLVIGLALVGYGLAQPSNTIVFVVGSGVLSSLLASLVLGFFTSKALGAQSQLVDKLLQLEKAAESRVRNGATFIDEKYSHKPEYWNQLSTNTSKQFLLIGHALDTWTRSEYRTAFQAAIVRVIKNKGDFCVLLLDPNGDAQKRIIEARGKDYRTNIETTLHALAEVRAKLPDHLKTKLDVRFLPPKEQPLYMAVVTDSSLEYSPYFVRASTRSAPHASFAISSSFANTVITDFQAIRPNSEPVDLSDY
jgi:hypothetical protein